MNQCPYRIQMCAPYLSDARELSAGLADSIEEHYCRGSYEACGRYRLARTGLTDDLPDVAPWTDVTA